MSTADEVLKEISELAREHGWASVSSFIESIEPTPTIAIVAGERVDELEDLLAGAGDHVASRLLDELIERPDLDLCVDRLVLALPCHRAPSTNELSALTCVRERTAADAVIALVEPQKIESPHDLELLERGLERALLDIQTSRGERRMFLYGEPTTLEESLKTRAADDRVALDAWARSGAGATAQLLGRRALRALELAEAALRESREQAGASTHREGRALIRELLLSHGKILASFDEARASLTAEVDRRLRELRDGVADPQTGLRDLQARLSECDRYAEQALGAWHLETARALEEIDATWPPALSDPRPSRAIADIALEHVVPPSRQAPSPGTGQPARATQRGSETSQPSASVTSRAGWTAVGAAVARGLLDGGLGTTFAGGAVGFGLSLAIADRQAAAITRERTQRELSDIRREIEVTRRATSESLGHALTAMRTEVDRRLTVAREGLTSHIEEGREAGAADVDLHARLAAWRSALQTADALPPDDGPPQAPPVS